VNTNNKCYSFDNNAIFFQDANYETIVVKIPSKSGLINSNSIIKNNDYKAMEGHEKISPMYNLVT